MRNAYCKTIRIAALLAMSGLIPSAENQTKPNQKQVVDSGSFGIFLNGKRVGTETFRIEQGPDVSIARSQIKTAIGSAQSEQSSEMQVAPDGVLRRYIWHATLPQKEESVVEPKEQLLIQHATSVDQKKHDIPYVLPLSTVILDDNFFTHREILIWRYLAAGCAPQGDQLRCTAVQFGALVPRQHSAGSVAVEMVGREKIQVKGVERELNKLRLVMDSVQWFLWVTDPEERYKVVKMAIPATAVEIVRD